MSSHLVVVSISSIVTSLTSFYSKSAFSASLRPTSATTLGLGATTTLFNPVALSIATSLDACSPSPQCSTQLCCFGRSCHHYAPAAECQIIQFAIRARLPYVAAEWSLLCYPAHYVAFVVTCLVVTWAVATLGLITLLVFNVAPAADDLTPAVKAHMYVWLDWAPHLHCLETFHDSTQCHVPPFYNEDYRPCSTFCILSSLPNRVGVLQSPHLGWDCYALTIHFKFLSHLLQSFCAFPC